MRIYTSAIIVLLLILAACDDNKGTISPPDYVFPDVWDTPAWSPDGKTIAAYFTGIYYVDPKTGDASMNLTERGLWLMDVDGSNKRMKYNNQILTPSWHPNGDSLAFTVGYYTGYVAKADTSIDSLISLSDEAGYYNPSWSPDGSKLVYNGIWLMNSDGTNKELIESGTAPAFSPDGSMIAFSNAHDSNGGISIMNLLTDSLTVFLKGVSADKIVWFPNGSELLFSNDLGIYRYSLDDSTLLHIASNASYPSISPDGSKIVYLHHTWTSYSPENGHLFTMDTDGNNRQQITYTEGGGSLK